jgi:hypothetical protein
VAAPSVLAELVFTDPRAVRALLLGARELYALAEDQPWHPGLKRAARALRYAARHIRVRPAEEPDA